MSELPATVPPIVLIHGLWMTARSWDGWVEYYRAKGHEVIVPTYPGFEIEVEALRERPEIIAEASVPATVDHLSEVIEGLDRPPGHQETWVDYDLDGRTPLLSIMGGKDHLMPPSMQRANTKKYRNSEATTETYEFPERSHFTGVEPGW
jgi:pimeloyl-ACP methyl ester carboxylesterase